MKLDIGSGGKSPGFISVDPYCDDADVQAFMWDLPYDDNSVDMIYSSHALEHIEKRAVLPTLKEWRRVLTPGGTIRLLIPDLEWCCTHYLECLKNETLDNPIIGWDLDIIFGNQNHDGEFHKTGFTERSIKWYMKQAGLSIVQFNRISTHSQMTMEIICTKTMCTS